MKFKIFSLAVLFFGILSCSKDDEVAPEAVIPPPATSTNLIIDAVNDDFTFTPFGALGGATISVLSNDKLNNVILNPNLVTLTPTGSIPLGLSIGSDGIVTISANTLAGTYVLDYKIVENANLNNFDVATVTLEVNTPTTFLPTTLANRWTYDTQTIVTAFPNTLASTTTGLDELYVESEVTLNNLAFKLMKTSPIKPTGFYSTMLNNNKVRIDGSSVKVTGNISFVVSGSTLNLTINDFTAFKENAAANTVVGDTGDKTITQTFQGFPVTATYRLTSTATGDSANMSYNGNNYTNIKKNIIKLRLSVNASTQFSTLPILIADDVIISDQYYSKNIGLVKAITKIEYHISTTARAIWPPSAPADGIQNITENLKLKNF